LNLTTDGFGPKSRTWPELSDALIEYGNTGIRAWVVTGHVFAKCKEKGVLLDARGFSIPRPDALIMAEDTVADAIINFRDYVLKQNKWDPSKGASLTTFFVGNCLLRFPNIYREWINEQNKTRKHDPIDGVELINRLTPEMQVIRRDESERNVEHMLAGLTEQERTALTLKAEGWGIDEIAEVLELSYKAAESVMYRARQAVKKGTQT
jgi:RNA polymerase sigma factor (sigma-70 family)